LRSPATPLSLSHHSSDKNVSLAAPADLARHVRNHPSSQLRRSCGRWMPKPTRLSVVRAVRPDDFCEFAPEIARSSGGARLDIGVDFAQLRSVTTFRRGYAVSIVAALLIVFAVSPA